MKIEWLTEKGEGMYPFTSAGWKWTPETVGDVKWLDAESARTAERTHRMGVAFNEAKDVMTGNSDGKQPKRSR
jgi:hypothetical protein